MQANEKIAASVRRLYFGSIDHQDLLDIRAWFGTTERAHAIATDLGRQGLFESEATDDEFIACLLPDAFDA